MSFYTTPLQLGYFFALLMAVIFWIRSFREQRLSDFFLGSLFFLLMTELQDYTFGFAGINILWEKLNGFPRNGSLLIGPVIYFYLQSQINQKLRLRKANLVHLLPFMVYFIVEISVFIQGPYAVQKFQQSNLSLILFYINWVAMILSYTFYFYKSLRLYHQYRSWTINYFSNTSFISFEWFRNFLYVLIACVASKEIFHLIDFIFLLDFNEDWYWNLVIVGTVFYIGLTAYSQRQLHALQFDRISNEEKPVEEKETAEKPINSLNTILVERLNRIMLEDSLYLQAELNLSELSKHLKVNNNQLSACINHEHKMNFNDYINNLRIQEFERKLKEGQYESFTLLALAFDCGFNSKTTFNRAFKKHKGISPNEFLKTVKA